MLLDAEEIRFESYGLLDRINELRTKILDDINTLDALDSFIYNVECRLQFSNPEDPKTHQEMMLKVKKALTEKLSSLMISVVHRENKLRFLYLDQNADQKHLLACFKELYKKMQDNKEFVSSEPLRRGKEILTKIDDCEREMALAISDGTVDKRVNSKAMLWDCCLFSYSRSTRVVDSVRDTQSIEKKLLGLYQNLLQAYSEVLVLVQEINNLDRSRAPPPQP